MDEEQNIMEEFQALVRKFNYNHVAGYYGSMKDTCINKNTPKETVEHIKSICKTIKKGNILICPENNYHGNFMFIP